MVKLPEPLSSLKDQYNSIKVLLAPYVLFKDIIKYPLEGSEEDLRTATTMMYRCLMGSGYTSPLAEPLNWRYEQVPDPFLQGQVKDKLKELAAEIQECLMENKQLLIGLAGLLADKRIMGLKALCEYFGVPYAEALKAHEQEIPDSELVQKVNNFLMNGINQC